MKDEEARQQIQAEIDRLRSELEKVDSNLTKRNTVLKRLNQTIEETENAYKNILESSHSLLKVLKREKTQMEQSLESN
jgi:Sjoegren syndrome nuclear autoantigen 1